MIRLATAHAKCRLSKTVDLQDAEVAVELIEYAYFKKVIKSLVRAYISQMRHLFVYSTYNTRKKLSNQIRLFVDI